MMNRMVSGSMVDLAVSGRVSGNWRSYRPKQECVAHFHLEVYLDLNNKTALICNFSRGTGFSHSSWRARLAGRDVFLFCVRERFRLLLSIDTDLL